MTHHHRAMGLLGLLARGLLQHGEQQTVRQLGDRSTYVGLSDVARAVTCMRAAVASKVGAKQRATADDIGRWLRTGDSVSVTDLLRRQMVLQRGHWLETGLEAAFRANGANLISQMEIVVPGSMPLRAHLDFTFVGVSNRPAIRILELKSTEHLPQTLYPGYEAQLYGQLGLLTEFWAKPVFGAGEHYGLTFPELCHRLLGIALPATPGQTDLEGWVLCLSMSEAKAFGPYRPEAAMLNFCRRTADNLWSTSQKVRSGQVALDDVAICQGFHPLCDWCEHAEGCPKFAARPITDPAIDIELAEFSRLKAERSALEREIEEKEARIRRFCRLAGSGAAWLSTGKFRFKTTRIAGRRTIDPAKLRASLTALPSNAQADALLADATTIGADYERLTVSAIKQPTK